jgi:hypothetical protein
MSNSSVAAQLCRELQLAGVEPMLSADNAGAAMTGVALIADAQAIKNSSQASARFREQSFDVLANGMPLSVSIRGLGTDAEASETYSRLCDVLRSVMQDASVTPGSVEIVIEAGTLSPHCAWLTRREMLGDGPVYMLAGRPLMQPGDAVDERRDHEIFWSQMWNLRMDSMVRAAYAPAIFSRCPLLSAEVATGVLPAAAIQAPAGTAWVPMRVDLSQFVDDRGVLRESALERALCRCIEIGDDLHDLATWPTAQMRHDAWLNRRLAVVLTGFGDLALKRNLDPRQFSCLASLSEILHWAQDILQSQSQIIARRTGSLPALSHCDPSRTLPGGHVRDGWHKRWRHAVEVAAVRHRNVLVLSPWSVFPAGGPAEFSYADLLPLLGIADACAATEPPDLAHWNISKFKSFHQRAWAVLQQRDASHQIAV